MGTLRSAVTGSELPPTIGPYPQAVRGGGLLVSIGFLAVADGCVRSGGLGGVAAQPLVGEPPLLL
jgi:hypothetical protein